MRQGMLAAFLAGTVAAFSGCAAPRAIIGPLGKLQVLDPAAMSSLESLRDGWVIEGSGDIARDHLSVVYMENVSALRVVNSIEGFFIVRRTQAMLLATPFLNWAWNMEAPPTGVHPVRLVIGFHSSKTTGGGWRNLSFFRLFGSMPNGWQWSTLPRHDRLLAIVWGESALQRGKLSRPSGNRQDAPRYTARGGRENAGKWWEEAVDLSRLYASVWPEDDLSRVRVMFIGIAAADGYPPAAAHVSKIMLTR